jgi:uncharacterized LabA/DUF88 family protein
VENEQVPARNARVHVFVDFWNFHLTLKKVDPDFSADFKALGPILVDAASQLVDGGVHAEYAGMGIYMSTNEKSEAEAGLRKWATQVVDRFPGVNVTMIPRVKEVSGPKCPQCHDVVHNCPACGGDMRGTEEKGVDVRIATDMIMLAWVDSYDIAVLVSSDSDFVPVASFLQTKGKKVIHGALPPRGQLLSQKCWGSIDVIKLREKFRFVPKPKPGQAAAIKPIFSKAGTKQ